MALIARTLATPGAWFLASVLCSVPALRAEDILRLPIGDPARREREVSLVLDGITDTASGAVLTPGELPARLSGVRLLLLGEEHTNADDHAVEERVVEELHRAGRRVVVGLEMFPYTEQAALDDWSDGKLSEEAFLNASRWYRSWGYNWRYYRDVFLFARDNRLRMVAINAPREVVSAVRKKGFRGLTAEEAAHIPTKIDTQSPDQMRLFRASFEDGGFHAGMSDEDWQAMLNAQCTWDATMAFHAVAALARETDPKTILVVLAGSGHVQYGLGIERQARESLAGKVASLIPVPLADAKKKPVRSVQASYANFLWGTPATTDPEFPDLGVSTRPAGEEPLLEILHVEKDSPAQRAGLATGDVLLTMDDAKIADREALARAMAGKRWGDAAVFAVRRAGKPVTVVVPLRREASP